MSHNKKPLILPGLVWDEERQRYFPVSSRPKRRLDEDGTNRVNTSTSSEPSRINNDIVNQNVLKIKARLREGTSNYAQRATFVHEMEKKSLGSYYTELNPPLRPLSWEGCKVSALHATVLDDTLNVLIGDSDGYLHCSRAVAQSNPRQSSEPDRFNHNSRLFTSYYTGICKPIRHILRSEETAVSITDLYDSCYLCTRDLKAPDSQGIIYSKIKAGRDVWAANLHKQELSLSMAGRLVVAKDYIDLSKRNLTIYPLKSDALSMCRRENTIFTGLRNGNILLFDVRAAKSAGTDILGPQSISYPKKRHSTITHLQTVREWDLLVGTISGGLEMFDLRFCSGTRSAPYMTFKGHVNSYLLNLGLSIDPTSTFLFAAGQDCRIRAWSLRTGEFLGSLFGGTQLPDPVQHMSVTLSPSISSSAISVSSEGCEREPLQEVFGQLWLWVSQEKEVRVIRLGRNDGDF